MQVIDINTIKVIDIPDDYIECSVCGEYHPQSDYRGSNQSRQTRTNCKKCYNEDLDRYSEIKARVAKIKKSQIYLKIKDALQLKLRYMSNSISVADMIKYLSDLNPNDQIFIGQDGYYAEGKFADIFKPEIDVVIDDVTYYEIGHSSQNY